MWFRVALIAIVAGIVFGAGWYLNGTRWESKYQKLELKLSTYETDVADARAKGILEGQAMMQTEMDRQKDAYNVRAAELAAIATTANTQRLGSLRLCSSKSSGPVPAANPVSTSAPASSSSASSGVVPAGLGNPGTLLDPTPIHDRLVRAEEVAADLRLCLALFPRPHEMNAD